MAIQPLASIDIKGGDRMKTKAKMRIGSTICALGVVLAGCTSFPIQQMSEAEHVSRLTGQGFTLVSDGRANNAPSVLQYSGPAAPVIRCFRGDETKVDLNARDTVVSSEAGKLRLVQKGQVNARVVAGQNGTVSGAYFYTVNRQVFQGRKIAGSELETIEFAPDASASLADGARCGPRY